MKLVDANVLLYAVNSDSPQHETSRRWLNEALVGDETVGLPWLSLIAFARLATHPVVFPAPLSADEALDRVERWLAAPSAVSCNPGPRHVDLWRQALRAAGTGGNLVNAAHLAALALEHKATIVTFDVDFARFPGLRWHTPTQLLVGST